MKRAATWVDLGTRFEAGPEQALAEGRRWILRIGFVVIGLGIVLGSAGYVLGWFSEAAQVAQEEFGPRAMLQKYEWFKDASAQLDKKVADVAVFEAQIAELQTEDDPDRFSRSDLNQWRRELAGIKASYNLLSGEYNSQMAKFNWAFANVGTLPPGAEMPLPREYKPYIGR